MIALLTVLALVLTACGSDDSAGVTVGSNNVSAKTLDAQLAAIAKNPALKSQAVVKGKIAPTAVATWLTHVVEIEVARQAVQKAGTKITKADKSQAQDSTESFFGGSSAFGAFPKSFRDDVIASYANVPAFVRTHTKAPTDAEVRKSYDDSLAQSCPSHRFVSQILSTSEAAAQAAAAQLAQGTDFKQVAAQSSADQQTASRGGAFGCIDQAQLDPTLTAAIAAVPVGQTSSPVQLSDGWHIIKVQDPLEALPFEGVKGEIRSNLIETGPDGTKALVKLMAAAKVTVAHRFGRWVVKDGQGSVQAYPTSTTTTKPRTSTTKPPSSTTTKP